MNIIINCLCIVATFFYLLSTPVLAADDPQKTAVRASADATGNQLLRVTPVIIDKKLIPGKEVSQEIKLENLSSIPIGITVSVEDFEPYDSEENMSLLEQRQSPLVSWTSVSKRSMIIDPLSSKTFMLSIYPPTNAPDGGYYSMVFLTPFFTKPLDKNKPTILSKIGVLLLTSIGDQNAHDATSKVQIDYEDTSFLHSSTEIPVGFAVENNYFTYFSAKPRLEVYPLFGKVQSFEFEDKKILPGKTRSWHKKISLTPALFQWYRARLAVSVGQGEYVYANTTFVVFPYKQLVLPAGFILMLIVMIVYRKKIKKIVNVFFGARI